MFQKRLGLKELEQAVNQMQAGGVTPNRETITVVSAVANALGVKVTAKQEAEAEVSAQKSAAQAVRNRAMQAQKATTAQMEALRRQIRDVERAGQAQVSRLQTAASKNDARAGKVKELLTLL